MDRLAKLNDLLTRQPDDLFLLYALAMEYRKANNKSEALRYLDRVIAKDPLYCAAYQQAGQIHEEAGDIDSARKAYQSGMEAAGRKGDAHAREEMAAALDMLS